jgi:hypothetical protein
MYVHCGFADDEAVDACLKSQPYVVDKQLLISVPLGDNLAAFQKVTREFLGIDPNVFQTHASAIAKLNCTHHQHFDSVEVFEELCLNICCAMR